MTEPFDLRQNPVHLGRGATAVVEPTFTGHMERYMAYGQRHADDGFEGRLVALHEFTGPWDSWEMHPKGHEVVVCMSGRMVLHQETPDGVASVVLEAGQGAINAPGVWHTADIEGRATGLFITAGEGTEVRARRPDEQFDVA